MALKTLRFVQGLPRTPLLYVPQIDFPEIENLEIWKSSCFSLIDCISSCFWATLVRPQSLPLPYSMFWCATVHTVHAIHIVHIVHIVHTVHTVQTINTVHEHTVHTVPMYMLYVLYKGPAFQNDSPVSWPQLVVLEGTCLSERLAGQLTSLSFWKTPAFQND